MKIGSWNVNSLNVRLAHVLQWLEDEQPDVPGVTQTPGSTSSTLTLLTWSRRAIRSDITSSARVKVEL